MTFIASVVARDGVAIIADSFVTREVTSITLDQLTEHLKEKGDNNLSVDELTDLFTTQAHYTRNYANKLFQLDKWTAITTAGHAYINGKLISEQIDDFKLMSPHLEEMPISEKLLTFCNYIRSEIINQLNAGDDSASFSQTVFIVSHYNENTHKPEIHKITIRNIEKTEIIANPDCEFIKSSDETVIKLVCDGQNRISDRLLYGTIMPSSNRIIAKIAFKVLDEAGITDDDTRKKAVKSLFDGNGILFEDILKDLEVFRIRELSLQEAVNLAGLLMKIVIDFQVYTEKVPTVGGMIKIATIDKANGFQYISGHKIEPPHI